MTKITKRWGPASPGQHTTVIKDTVFRFETRTFKTFTRPEASNCYDVWVPFEGTLELEWVNVPEGDVVA